MKTLPRLLRAAPPLLLCLACALASAQRHAQQTPPQGETLGQVAEQLDAAGLVSARVGVYGYYWEDDSPYVTFESESKLHYNYALFSRGFRLAKVEGCTLTLRNDDVTILGFSDSEREAKPCVGPSCERRVAEVQLSLDKMSVKKHTGPRLQKLKADKARTFGAWRTEFKHEGLVSKKIAGVVYFPAGDWGKRRYFNGNKVSFSFDDEGTGAKFHALLLRAIRMCEE